VTAPETGLSASVGTEPGSPVVPEAPNGLRGSEAGALSLTRTGEENGRIVGILTTPDGGFRLTATPAAWAESEADVAAGRNPMLLDTLLTSPREEINP
jgi:hypothetical protein